MEKGYLKIVMIDNTIINISVNFPRTMTTKEIHENIKEYIKEEIGEKWRCYNLDMERDMRG